MLEAVFRSVLQAVFGGGSDISAANPLPVATSPGAKSIATILDEASIAAATTTGLDDCDPIDLSSGPDTLAVTVKARYNAAATQGIKVHVRTSPTNDAAGIHTGGVHATIMTDANAHFIVNELVGLTIENVIDGSSGVVTANTETTVTVAALAGGTANQWATNDVYSIDGADFDTEDWDSWSAAFTAGAVLRQTKHYSTDPMYLKVLIENLDPAQTVTDVLVIVTKGA